MTSTVLHYPSATGANRLAMGAGVEERIRRAGPVPYGAGHFVMAAVSAPADELRRAVA
ncbi:MAG: hypothetical protein M3Y17_14140 [Actinomycetota bacterium]|nr:hypothetical protein [Actinomycetota bacterium]